MEIDISPQTIQAIGWFYVLTSALRVVAYAPQVALIWRCPEGGRSVSLTTWIASTLSHGAATIYGAAVVADPCLTAIAVGNTAGSLAIVWVALVRRSPEGGATALAPLPAWLLGLAALREAMRPQGSAGLRGLVRLPNPAKQRGLAGLRASA